MMNNEENNSDPVSEISNNELNNTCLFALPGRNLIRPLANPNHERTDIIPAEEIIALVIPTSSAGYDLAASIQKKNPIAAYANVPKYIKKEFLYN